MQARISELEAIVKEEGRIERARIRKGKLEEQKVETIRRRKEKEEKEKAEKEALREFMRPREDLTLNDLKELPEPTPLEVLQYTPCAADAAPTSNCVHQQTKQATLLHILYVWESASNILHPAPT